MALVEFYLHGFVWALAIVLADWPKGIDYRAFGFRNEWHRDLGAALALALCWPYLLWWFYYGKR